VTTRSRLLVLPASPSGRIRAVHSPALSSSPFTSGATPAVAPSAVAPPALGAAQVTAATRAAFAQAVMGAPWRWLARITAAWIGVALLFTTQAAIRSPERSVMLFVSGLASFAPCVLLTPGVAWVTLHFRFIADRWAVALLAHVVGAATFAIVGGAMMGAIAWAQPWLDADPRLPQAMATAITRYLAVDVLLYALIAVCVLAAAYAREARDRAVAAAQLQTQLATARLHTLSAQLQPHFLFNTLHAISSLVRHDPRRAEQLITRLSDLLRHSLNGAQGPEGTLEEELEFLGKYVEIQETRHDGRLAVSCEIAPDVRGLLVPRLILQPIVENAIRHGVLRRSGPGHVVVAARREDDALVLVVEDDGVGLPSGRSIVEGIGLSTTRDRLRQLYGTAHSFALVTRAEGGARCTIRVPARRGASA
jgi:signal transduction histidine kinase